MQTETKTVSLLEYNNEQPITYLWICGVGCPAGIDFNHDTEDEEEYCDFADLDILKRLLDLEGYVDDSGRWCMHDDSDICDDRGNTIYNVKASR